MKKNVQPLNPMPDGTCRTLKGQYHKNSLANFIRTGGYAATAVIENKDMDKIEKDSFLPEELKGKKFRIRKLTPRECFRLMDVDDADIDKIQAYPYESLVEHPAYSKEERFRGMTEKEKRAAMKNSISNSAQFKLAGNSIVVNVLYHIFRKMFIETGPETATQPQQLSLF